MKYLIKFNDFSKVTEISNLYKLRVLNSLPKLKMLVFDFIPTQDDINLTKLRNEKCIDYIQKDEILNLDIESNVADIQEVSKKKVNDNVNNNTLNKSTFTGTFSSGDEYYSHLELLNSDDYSNDLHEFSSTMTGDGVDIFIFDTGVNFNHPNLIGRVNRVPNFNLNLDGVEDNDNNGHGTKSALMAAGNNCGVAVKSRIYSVKVLKESGSGSSIDIAIGIDAVISFSESTGRPSIANLSLGIFPNTRSTWVSSDKTGTDHFLNDGCKQMASVGIHTIIAAGNGFYDFDINNNSYVRGPMMSEIGGGRLNLSPEETHNQDPGQGDVIVVGATQTKPGRLYPNSDPAKMASFSNYGRGNTINTAGNNIIAPSWNWSEFGTNNNYSIYNGTSFACPIISGLVALRLQDKPTESVQNTKKWLKENARKNKIKNLISKQIVKKTKIFKWNSATGILSIFISTDSDVKFSNTIKSNDGLLQYSINDEGILLDNYIKWKNLNYNYNDGWWEIVEVNDYSLKIKPRLGYPQQTSGGITMDLTSESFEVGIETDFIYSHLLNKHEETDGIKDWQTEDNQLSGSWEKIYDVSYTDNLCAFNPYQSYSFQYSNGKPKIILPDAFTTTPFENANFVTSRGDVPIKTKIKISELDGIIVTDEGNFIQNGFNLSINEVNLPTSVEVEYTNGYETFTDTLEVVDNTKPPNILRNINNFIWYGYQGATEKFDLKTNSNIKLVYQIEITNAGTRIICYSKNIPDFITQPFTELCPGFGYYIILESDDGISPNSEVLIPNAIVSGDESKNLLIS